MPRFLSSTPSVLRDYQKECIDKSLLAYHQGITRQAVSLPVGSGKTVIFSNLIKQFLPQSGKKTLVLAHREELLLQACRQISKWCPGSIVHLEQGPNSADPKEADIVVASVPTLGRVNSDERRLKYNPAEFKCIVVDESHHAAAPSYLRIFEHFGIFHEKNDILLWGCSATLSRNDDLALSSVFQKVIYHVDMKRMMDEGWLCPAKVYQIETDIDLSGVRMSDYSPGGRDFDNQELSLAINTPERNRLVVETWRDFALNSHGCKSTIVFGLSVEHVEGLKAEFLKIGIRAEVITGSTPDAVRLGLLEEFSNGKLPVLVNCAVLTEGTDLPITDCILLTRPTCNSNLYIQMVGRGLRRHPNKSYCLVLDVVDKMKGRMNHRSLITFPTLEAAIPESRNKSTEQGESSLDKREETKPEELCQLDRIKVNLRHTTDLNIIPDLQLHRIAWVKLNDRIYLCSGRDHEFLLEIHDLNDLQLNSSLKSTKDKSFTTTGPLHECLESFALFLRKQNLQSDLMSNAFWRRRFPMTDAQYRMLKSLGERLGACYDDFAVIKRWNVGQASNILNRYFGSRNYLPESEHIKAWPQLINGVNFQSFYSFHRKSSSKTIKKPNQLININN